MTLREYMNRVCLCGRPRSEHCHTAKLTAEQKRDLWIEVIGATGCRGFTDRVEQKLSGLGAYMAFQQDPDQEI